MITQSDNGTQIAIGCNSAAEKAQARAEAVRKDLAEGENIEAEARAAEDNHTQPEAAADVDNVPTAEESTPQADTVQSVDNVPAPESAAAVNDTPPKVCAAVVVVSNNRPRRSVHPAKRVNAPAVANHKPP